MKGTADTMQNNLYATGTTMAFWNWKTVVDQHANPKEVLLRGSKTSQVEKS